MDAVGSDERTEEGEGGRVPARRTEVRRRGRVAGAFDVGVGAAVGARDALVVTRRGRVVDG